MAARDELRDEPRVGCVCRREALEDDGAMGLRPGHGVGSQTRCEGDFERRRLGVDGAQYGACFNGAVDEHVKLSRGAPRHERDSSERRAVLGRGMDALAEHQRVTRGEDARRHERREVGAWPRGKVAPGRAKVEIQPASLADRASAALPPPDRAAEDAILAVLRVELAQLEREAARYDLLSNAVEKLGDRRWDLIKVRAWQRPEALQDDAAADARLPVGLLDPYDDVDEAAGQGARVDTEGAFTPRRRRQRRRLGERRARRGRGDERSGLGRAVAGASDAEEPVGRRRASVLVASKPSTLDGVPCKLERKAATGTVLGLERACDKFVNGDASQRSDWSPGNAPSEAPAGVDAVDAHD